MTFTQGFSCRGPYRMDMFWFVQRSTCRSSSKTWTF